VISVAVPELRNRFVKFKVTGVNSNPADTVVTLNAICRELI
jgi:hypothetical protein